MDKKLLLIIPFYNEASRIERDTFTQAFTSHANCDFLLVNDGSSDNTALILNKLSDKFPNATALDLKKNGGKAEAIRQAVLYSKDKSYTHIGYLDADLATPFDEFFRIWEFACKNPNYTFVMGSRIKKLGSDITRYSYRHYSGRIFATIASKLILKAPVYDTQCGAKIITHDLAATLFEKPFITKWVFDLELLLRYREIEKNYLHKIFEYGLSIWIEKGDSKITFKDLLGFPYQLVKIHFAYGK
ncbi:glycosyltransferase [Flavobacterium alkalisoli]|uniref:Glycosyltransferase n=1 Tax=Flavobacterium alkalisoli TaxID=2602769 RepID=A0A5B9FZ11_9FLAO|nr:glycosyltransferase [Flavobacterium alkalisoli]QEE51286.1 glycosyltransferase [Flavobacterium alkalisoli]